MQKSNKVSSSIKNIRLFWYSANKLFSKYNSYVSVFCEFIYAIIIQLLLIKLNFFDNFIITFKIYPKWRIYVQNIRTR